MKHRVIVDQPAVAFLGQLGLSRNAILRLYTQLHQELGNEAARFRSTRRPEQPDLYFHYRIKVRPGTTGANSTLR